MVEGFAAEREWDLVEIVARRAIEGEDGSESRVLDDVDGAAAERYHSINAWAWKAVGVVELVSCIRIRVSRPATKIPEVT